jgi:Na+/melibiose symporter-like transporter
MRPRTATPLAPSPGPAALSRPLLAYGVGDMSVTVGMVLFGLFALFFYGSVMKLPATLVGAVSALGLIGDALIDPSIGHWSDNHRSRFGRRHGFMLVGALASGVAFWALLSPPSGLGAGGVFAWLLATTVLFRFTSALFRIPYLGLGAELSRDYDGRTLVVGVRAFFGLVGTLAAAVLSFLVFFPPGDADAKFEADNYARIGQVFGLVIVAAGLLAVAGTWSCRHLEEGAGGAGRSVRTPLAAAFRSAWAHRPFRRMWLGFTLFFVAVVLNASLAIHYFTWYAAIPDATVIGWVQLAFYAGALAGVLAWVRLARRVEKRPLCLASLLGTSALMAMATLLVGEGRIFGTGNPAPLVAGNLLAGLWAAGVWVLPGSMLADIADLDQLRGGRRREGLFFGLTNFGEKVGAGVGLLLAGVLLDVFVGLGPAGAQTPQEALRIGLLYGLAPAVLLVAAAAALAGYDLSRESVTAIQSALRRNPGAPSNPGQIDQPAALEGAPWRVSTQP